MSTVDVNDQVSGQFEACARFGGDSAVCEHCGWLDEEHGLDAEIHAIHALPVATPRPARLAS